MYFKQTRKLFICQQGKDKTIKDELVETVAKYAGVRSFSIKEMCSEELTNALKDSYRYGLTLKFKAYAVNTVESIFDNACYEKI